jgi:hypothetical protein
MNGQNEAFSRILIDKALEFSGWNLLDDKQVQFESHTSNGRADYLLKDKLGRVLCVLEAKREDLDPYDAKEQARGYAVNLKAPFVILSNRRLHVLELEALKIVHWIRASGRAGRRLWRLRWAKTRHSRPTVLCDGRAALDMENFNGKERTFHLSACHKHFPIW